MIFWRSILIIWIVILSADIYADNIKHKVTHTKSKFKKLINTKSSNHQKIIYGKQNLVLELNSILKNNKSNFNVGINIRSMKHGDTIYTKNNNKLFIPASIIKILTAEAALLYLGSDFKFLTTLLTNTQETKNGVVDGDVFLVQTGDPSLTYSDLTDLMVTLKEQQINIINGNIFIDNTAYDENIFGPGWFLEDKQSCYGAPISASIINHNCLSVKISPSKKIGRLANIIKSPHYYYKSIQNSIITKKNNTKSCYIKFDNYENGSISLGGCMRKNHDPAGVSAVISNILQYNKSMLKSLFKRYGIRIKGFIGSGKAPENLSIIAVHHSEPLHTLVNKMLKKSDNIIAGSLLKKMGEIYTKSPGGWINGGDAIKNILTKKAFVNSKGLVIVDGSGLSRENKIKPSQMMQVLDFAYHNYGTNYEFISSLPIAGRDGTLKNRLHIVATKVRAKTGTMSGVVSLAGYAYSKDKEPFAFVIMINGQNGMSWKYREIEDKIVIALTKYSRGL
ncbi:D-alanyl-D-alanine carboxypeptidase/D-alanyl-D-alanine-endopeptidase [Gammaproteobacteria bacterium]|nr:D-alanyl-D-alanine carboxypeptidase/D-alanyl-D-alanine-endopeptidase [Gammaproteobacteria bacterium]